MTQLRTYTVTLALLLALVATGCDDLLSVTPPTQISEERALTSPQGIENAIVGAYDLNQGGNLHSGNFVIAGGILADVLEDNGPGNTVFEQNELLQRRISPGENAIVQGMWGDGFRIINACNRVLKALDGGVEGLSETDQRRLRGEALFLRAAIHFELNRYFGHPNADAFEGSPTGGLGVPIITDPVQDAEEGRASVPRAPQQDVYEFVISDFIAAADLLAGNDAGTPGRATEFGAKAYAARAAFFAGGVVDQLEVSGISASGPYQIAFNQANDVIENGSYSLASSVEANFQGDLTATNEVLFGILNSEQDEGGSGALHFGLTQSAGNPPFGLSEDAATFLTENSSDNRQDNLYTEDESRGVTYTGKWSNRYLDVPVIRLAEMYLTRAEAGLETGQGDPAADVNAVRGRSGLVSLGSVTRADIRAERRRELAVEANGDYFHNLKRIQASTSQQFFDINAVTFPIPLGETLISEDMQQNPGY